MKVQRFEKYKASLLLLNGEEVWSYTTHVGTINDSDDTLIDHGYWSKTTRKHINYVAKELNLNVKYYE